MEEDERKNKGEVLELTVPDRGLLRNRCTSEKTERKWADIRPVLPNYERKSAAVTAF